jgi:hypothetical protein
LATRYTAGGQAFNKSISRRIILLHIIIRHHLRIALVQVKLAIDFLLPDASSRRRSSCSKGRLCYSL